MKNEINSFFNPDSPGQNPAQDKLSFKTFAEQIANGLARMSAAESLVLSINGEWGAGKSTFVNYITFYLSLKSPETRILEFKPWWFSSHENLTSQLLRALAEPLQLIQTKQPNDCDHKSSLNELVLELAEAATSSSETGFEWNNSPTGISIDLSAIKAVEVSQLSAPKGISELKRLIHNALIDTEQKVVVVIEDIDRLSVDQLKDIFKTMKVIADLPGVIYLLPLDHQVVSRALENHFQGRGDKYLEKVIQVTFDLPAPPKGGVESMLREGLEELFSKLKVEKFESDRFDLLFRLGLGNIITTPRCAVRLMNVLKVTIPSVLGEVNLADFIAIEACRLFLPEVYLLLKQNKDTFAPNEPTAHKSQQQALAEFHRNWLGQIDKRKLDWGQILFTELFPQLNFAFAGTAYGTQELRVWRKELRICSPEMFERYFTFGRSDETLSMADRRQFLEENKNAQALHVLETKLKSSKVSDKQWLKNLIESLTDFDNDEISSRAAEQLFTDFLSAWASCNRSSVRALLNFSSRTEYDMEILLLRLLQRLESQDRLKVILKAIQRDFPAEIMLRIVQDLEKASPTRVGKKEILDQVELASLKAQLPGQLLRLFNEHKFDDPWDVAKILYAFHYFDRENLTKVVSLFKNSFLGVVALISYGGVENVSFSHGPARPKYEIELEKVGTIIDLKELHLLARDLKVPADATERGKMILESFIQQMNEEPKNLVIA